MNGLIKRLCILEDNTEAIKARRRQVPKTQLSKPQRKEIGWPTVPVRVGGEVVIAEIMN